MNRINKATTLANVFRHIALFIGIIFVLFPLFTMVMTSFKSFEDVTLHPTKILPTKWVFTNFITIFKEFPFFRYLLNTLYITFMTVLGTTLSSSLVAYGFAKFRFKYKNIIFSVMLATIFIPGQVLQIPIYELYNQFRSFWFNTYRPMIIPAFLGGGIANVFLIRQFIQNIPEELFESAKMEGANELQIFFKIVVPIAKPIIITVAIFTFVGSWNDFFSPLLYLTDDSKYNLAYGLYITFSKFEVAGNTQWNLVAASNLVVTLPIIILYFFCQKYFVEGITLGAVKE